MSTTNPRPALTAEEWRECRKCGDVKRLDAFPKRPPRYAAGRARECTKCYNARRRSETYRRINRVSARRQYERNPEKFKKKRNAYPRETGADKMDRAPIKESARRKLRWAVRSGAIQKPDSCQSCGKPSLLHGHHRDYSKPLTVEWLCHVCHMREHRKPDA